MPADLTTPKGIIKAKTRVRDEIRSALYDVGKYARAKARKYPPPPPNATYERTGTLGKRTGYGKVAKRGHGYVLPFGTNVPYAPFVETGTGIYGPYGRPIRPKKGKFLVWENQKAGPKLIFAREVTGFEGWHFIENALTGPATLKYIDARYTQMVQRIVGQIGQ